MVMDEDVSGEEGRGGKGMEDNGGNEREVKRSKSEFFSFF